MIVLALTSLALSTNHEAPVISLDLASSGLRHSGRTAAFGNQAVIQANGAKQNSFADECAVKQNGGICSEPVATAYDHHDGDISHKITTTYTLFVDSLQKQNPEHVNSPRTATGSYRAADGSMTASEGIDMKMRGEWIMKYDVSDADGNQAESITFALILVDEIAPEAPTTTEPMLKYELCEDKTYEVVPLQTAHDAYDKTLTESNSIMEVRVSVKGTTVKLTDHVVPKGSYKALKSKLELDYVIESFDFADIFGQGNTNNRRETKGTIELEDTTAPTINPPTATVWQCGYEPDHTTYRWPTSSAYNDCYDDWADLSKQNVAITINDSPIDNGAWPFTGYTVAAKALFGSDSANTAHSRPQTLTLKYNVADNFGNNAQELLVSVTLEDTIAPTLYITQKVDHATGGTVENDTCHENSKTALSWSNSAQTMGDKTLEHCQITIDADHKMYTHGTTEEAVHTTNPMDSETEIQHSAGYAADYRFVQNLMVEGTGYRCSDQCSDTTTTVEWKATDCADGVNTEFNMLVPGTYFLKYTCIDEAKIATTACRTFKNVDKTRPVITVLEAANHNDGTWHVEASRDNNYVDAGATCSDMVDGNISQDVEVSGDVVNMATVGTYTITYNCLDSAGQQAYPASRVVIVEDKTCPTCTIPGGEDVVTVEASFPYTEETSSCTDTLDGLIGDATVYGSVDVEKTGTYILTYSVTDKNGNGADPTECSESNSNHRSGSYFTKTVVVEDTMVPIISLQYKGNKLMAETNSPGVNGWALGAVVAAISGVALLADATPKGVVSVTSVPV